MESVVQGILCCYLSREYQHFAVNQQTLECLFHDSQMGTASGRAARCGIGARWGYRTILYERKDGKVAPYGITVAEFTNRILELRNKLGKGGIKDEGLEVRRSESAGGKTTGNILAADTNSISYVQSSQEILRIVYESRNKRKPGGFYPKGANGRIAKFYL